MATERTVRVRVPKAKAPRLTLFHEAADADGGYSYRDGQWIVFVFRTVAHAASFRTRAVAICAELIEPPQRSGRSRRSSSPESRANPTTGDS